MNKSFRTAFWAMCLGLTVPMVLFIGVELTPGGRAARKSVLAANEYRGSLRGYWSHSQAKLAARHSAGETPHGTNGSIPPPLALARAKIPRRDSASAGGDLKVVLGPLLEPDAPPTEPEGGRDRRTPAVVTGNRPSIEVLRDPPEPAGDSRAIGARLDGIEEQLARLGRAIAAQSQREPAPDLAAQTAELLRQLRQVRDGEEPVSQIPRLSAPETDVESEPIVPDKKGTKPAEAGASARGSRKRS